MAALIETVFQRHGQETIEQAVRKGFPSTVLPALLRSSGLTLTELASSLNVSLRSLQRRASQKRFTAHESDLLYRLARIVDFASQAIGDRAIAVRWLKRPNEALGGETPLASLDTEAGARRVEGVLGRIAYGGVS